MPLCYNLDGVFHLVILVMPRSRRLHHSWFLITIVISIKGSTEYSEAIRKMMDVLGLSSSFHGAIDGKQNVPLQNERGRPQDNAGALRENYERLRIRLCIIVFQGPRPYLELEFSPDGRVKDDGNIEPGFQRFVIKEHYQNFSIVFLARKVARGDMECVVICSRDLWTGNWSQAQEKGDLPTICKRTVYLTKCIDCLTINISKSV